MGLREKEEEKRNKDAFDNNLKRDQVCAVSPEELAEEYVRDGRLESPLQCKVNAKQIRHWQSAPLRL